MTEKEKMQSQKLYDANYDSELERERIECKALCQEYNHLPIKETEKRSRLIKKILGKTGEKIHIEPDFWCDYGYCISAGENFYANHGLVVLDAGGVSFGDNVFVAPNCQIVPPQETFKICIPLQIARTGFREARTRFMRRI